MKAKASPPSVARFCRAVACIGGFSGALGQILILRELLVLSYGNELSAGLGLSSWLLWTGGGSGLGARIMRHRPPKPFMAALALQLMALLLPATVLWTRGSRLMWSIPQGELPTPFQTLALAFSSTAPFGLMCGILFALAWGLHRQATSGDSTRSLTVYLLEALGAACAGVLFYFVFLPNFPVLGIALLASFLPAVAGCLSPPLAVGFSRRSLVLAPRSLPLLVLGAASLALPQLEAHSRRWQWGPHLVAIRDTPFHNLALMREDGFHTFFANGLWAFSHPDPQSAETAVHPALLQHPAPADLLIIGGCAAGLPREALKHPTVKRLDCIEPDRELVEMVRRHLPASALSSLTRPGVSLVHRDAGAYIRETKHAYDAILMNAGDPMNAQMNRYYTVEFFRQAKRRLKPGGIFSFAVSSAPEMIGPAQLRFLQSVHATVREVFPRVMIFPGEKARIFAAEPRGLLIDNPAELVHRSRDRDLDPQYVRDFYFMDRLSPTRMSYFRTLLESGIDSDGHRLINRNLNPTCYFYSTVLWGAQIHTGFKDLLTKLSQIPPSRLWIAGCAFALLAFVSARRKILKPQGAVSLSVMATGALGMTTEIMLLLGFQTVAGFVYKQLALIIAFYMAGLALGTAGVARWRSRAPSIVGKRFMIVHALFSVYPFTAVGALLWLQETTLLRIFPPIPGVAFTGLALVGGMLGGMHFGLAVRLGDWDGSPSPHRGGVLYAWDLLGAAGGSLVSSLFLLPVYGLIHTPAFLCLLGGGSLAALWQARKVPSPSGPVSP